MKEAFSILKKDPSYRKLVTANFISGIGDWFSSVAILSLLLQITGTGLAVGITLAARTLPYLFMGPIGGILADKVNKKTILVVSDFARIFLAFSFHQQLQRRSRRIVRHYSCFIHFIGSCDTAVL
ncbi:Transmembrane secretion effector [Paenibacillaceae bacterium GAS479]|nr:Transmembrane secretion effector [Paenibacillaceae bacterium GAS479]